MLCPSAAGTLTPRLPPRVQVPGRCAVEEEPIRGTWRPHGAKVSALLGQTAAMNGPTCTPAPGVPTGHAVLSGAAQNRTGRSPEPRAMLAPQRKSWGLTSETPSDAPDRQGQHGQRLGPSHAEASRWTPSGPRRKHTTGAALQAPFHPCASQEAPGKMPDTAQGSSELWGAGSRRHLSRSWGCTEERLGWQDSPPCTQAGQEGQVWCQHLVAEGMAETKQ